MLAHRPAIGYETGAEAPVSPADAAARIAALEASLARANAALAARDLLIDTLRGQIARLRRMQFGASSEKLSREIEQLELAVEELETEHDAPGAEAADPGVAARPVPVSSLPGHLLREEIVHEPASDACTCPDCGSALRSLGSDAHEMLDIVPVRWRVVRNVRPKYSCRVCEKIVQARAPASAVTRGKATFATLAHVVVSKFDHHLPLYRQAGMMSPRSDMAKVIAYGTKRWPVLCCFLGDGRLEIENNIAERALRSIAVGRRKWLFAGSRAGGERAASIYTVIQTCKANGVDPHAYIADVIARVADHWPASRWDELMPWNLMPPADQPPCKPHNLRPSCRAYRSGRSSQSSVPR